MALESADKEKFYEILKSPYLEVSHYIDEYAVPLYYQEMKDDHTESQVSLYILYNLSVFFGNEKVKILCNIKYLFYVKTFHFFLC